MRKLILLVGLLQFPTSVLAHGGHGSGFVAGFTHSIFGIDHLLAILGVGLLGYFMDEKKWHFFSLSFLGSMILGGLFGNGQPAISSVETLITSSVILIGLALALRPKINNKLAMLMLAIFGLAHGYAHGVEIPNNAGLWTYIAGFGIAVIFLLTIGNLLSRFVRKTVNSERYYVLIGGFLAGCGVMLFFS